MKLIPTGGSGSNSEPVKGPYDLWKELHPNGTVEEFLESLKPTTETILYVQEQQPSPDPKQSVCLWLQTGLGQNGDGITLNLIRKKNNP